MSYETQKLKAKVTAQNRANQNAAVLYEKYREAFASFVGQKILKVDNKLTKKVCDSLPKLPFFHYRYNSDYSVVYIVKESEQVEGASSCVYAEASVYIGKMNNGVLTELYDKPEFKTYTVEQIEQLRKTANHYKSLYDSTMSELSTFGMYTN